MIKGFVTSADEAAALDEVMPFVEGGRGEVFVYRMHFEIGEGVDGSDGVLPDVSDDIVKICSFEEVDGIGGHPVFHVDVAH